GRFAEATDRLVEGEELLEQQLATGVVGHRGWDFHLLGRTSLVLRRFDDAYRLANRALECVGQPGFLGYARHLLGDIAAGPERFDAGTAEIHYREALALGESRGMRPLVAHCHLGLGRLYRRIDKRQQSDEYLRSAIAMYRDMGMTYWLEKAEAEIQ